MKAHLRPWTNPVLLAGTRKKWLAKRPISATDGLVMEKAGLPRPSMNPRTAGQNNFRAPVRSGVGPLLALLIVAMFFTLRASAVAAVIYGETDDTDVRPDGG